MGRDLPLYVDLALIAGSLVLLVVLIAVHPRRPPMDDPGALPLGYQVVRSGGQVVLLTPDDDTFGAVFGSVQDAADEAWRLHGKWLAMKARRQAELARGAP